MSPRKILWQKQFGSIQVEAQELDNGQVCLTAGVILQARKYLSSKDIAASQIGILSYTTNTMLWLLRKKATEIGAETNTLAEE